MQIQFNPYVFEPYVFEPYIIKPYNILEEKDRWSRFQRMKLKVMRNHQEKLRDQHVNHQQELMRLQRDYQERLADIYTEERVQE